MLNRLRANQLLEGAGCIVKGVLGIVGHSGGDGLEAFVQLAARAKCGVVIVFANLSEIVICLLQWLEHLEDPFKAQVNGLGAAAALVRLIALRSGGPSRVRASSVPWGTVIGGNN